MGWFKEASESSSRAGFWVPFNILIFGLYLFYSTPFQASRLEYHVGLIEKYTQKDDYIYIYIYGDEIPYDIINENHKQLLLPQLERNKIIEMWTKKEDRRALQIAIESNIICKYEWYRGGLFSLFFIIIGLIGIPIAIKARKNTPELFKRGYQKNN